MSAVRNLIPLRGSIRGTLRAAYLVAISASAVVAIAGDLLNESDITMHPQKRRDTADVCYSALDLVQLQDATTSFDGVWESMANQVPSVLEAVKQSHPDSRFGLVAFGDKPLSILEPDGLPQDGLGYEDDFCVNELMPLQKVDVQKTVDTIKGITNIVSGGGADWPEAQFEALYRTAMSPTIGWGLVGQEREWSDQAKRRFSRSVDKVSAASSGVDNAEYRRLQSVDKLARGTRNDDTIVCDDDNRLPGSVVDNHASNHTAELPNAKLRRRSQHRSLSEQSSDGPQLVVPASRSRSKVIMLVTDSIPHIEGDVLKITKRKLPKFSLSTDEISRYGSNYKCDAMEYPATEIVLGKLRELNIHLFVLAAQSGEIINGQFEPYEPIAIVNSRYWNPNNTRLWYADNFERYGASVFVAQLDPECKAYASAATLLLKNFLNWRCAFDPTLEPSPASVFVAPPALNLVQLTTTTTTTTTNTTTIPTSTTTNTISMTTTTTTSSGEDTNTNAETATAGGSSNSTTGCPEVPGDTCSSPSTNCCCVKHCCRTCSNLQAEFKVNAVLGFNSGDSTSRKTAQKPIITLQTSDDDVSGDHEESTGMPKTASNEEK